MRGTSTGWNGSFHVKAPIPEASSVHAAGNGPASVVELYYFHMCNYRPSQDSGSDEFAVEMAGFLARFVV